MDQVANTWSIGWLKCIGSYSQAGTPAAQQPHDANCGQQSGYTANSKGLGALPTFCTTKEQGMPTGSPHTPRKPRSTFRSRSPGGRRQYVIKSIEITNEITIKSSEITIEITIKSSETSNEITIILSCNFRNPHLRSDQAYVKACENSWGKLKHYGKTIGEVLFEWGIPWT